MNRCIIFALLSAPHSLFCISTNLKISEKIPGAPTWRWGEGIWLTGPTGLHRNSPQGLNISSIRVFDQIRDLEIPITLRPRCHNFTMILILDIPVHKHKHNGSLRTYVSTFLCIDKDLKQGSLTFWVRGPIYIFHIMLQAAVIAYYKIIMDILNIIIGSWATRQVT